MKIYRKKDLSVHDVRRFLEPGPIVLVSSRYKDETNIMTMGWHMVMDDSKSRIACYIWDQNYSRKLITKSRECVFNIPTVDIAPTVVKIGNCSGEDTDKFAEFGLTPVDGVMVKAPLIAECFANFECRLSDTRNVRKYSLFIFDVVKAHVAVAPKFPKTIHYRGEGEFMISGPTVAKYRRYFKPGRM